MSSTNNSYCQELSLFKPISLSEINELELLNRVDTKYVFPVSKLKMLLQKVSKDYDILEINDSRYFNYDTCYFDSPNNDLYLNHHNRRLNRYKVRHRTYQVNNLAYLEIKRKNNKGKTLKNRRKTSENLNLQSNDYEFIEQFVSLKNRDLTVSSRNSFTRITLVSFATKERITIDYNLSFGNNTKTQEYPYFAIAELKRSKQQAATPFAKVLKELKIYPRGFSKYCMGMALLHPELKQNTFKKNKLFLNRLKHVTTASI